MLISATDASDASNIHKTNKVSNKVSNKRAILSERGIV